MSSFLIVLFNIGTDPDCIQINEILCLQPGNIMTESKMSPEVFYGGLEKSKIQNYT